MRSLRFNFFLSLFVASFLALASCTSGGGNELSQDTVFLESGVKYIYLAKGEGLKMDTGSHVITHINLMVAGDTVWSTRWEDEEKFEFNAQKTSLIAGFDEVVMHARQGDRILAIIPPELGYGERGAGEDIPPNSTLYFDLDFLRIEEPKEFLSDVLYEKLSAEGVEEALAAYERIKGDTVTYNLLMGEWYSLHRKIMREGRFNEAVAIWTYKLKEEPVLAGSYYMAQAYDSLGNIKDAISTLENGLKAVSDTTGSGFMTRYINELKRR